MAPSFWQRLSVIATDLDPTVLTPGLTREEVLAAIKGHGKAVSAIVAWRCRTRGPTIDSTSHVTQANHEP